jgi:phage terminase small subunit
MAKYKEKKLTAKQKMFATEYLVDLHGTNAAIRAGYQPSRARSTSCRMLKLPRIKALVDAGIRARNKRLEVDADYVLAGALELYKRCMQAEPVRDSNGKELGEYRFDSSGASKALKLMGDHVRVNAFKGEDSAGNPIDNNWVVKIVSVTQKEYESEPKPR